MVEAQTAAGTAAPPLARPRSRGAWGRLAPLLVLAVALAQGLLHLFLLPPWQHYDEPTHFEHAWLIANRGRLPAPGDVDYPMRREVAASMVEHDFYWNLRKPTLLTDRQEIWIGFSELGHPPAYYLLASAPLRLLRHINLSTQLYAARLVSVGLFLVTVGCALGTLRELAPPGHALRWLVPLALALLPPFASQMTAVNNDAGGVATMSLFVWGAARTIRRGITLPRLVWLLGAALLAAASKNTAGLALLFVPLVVGVAWWARRGWRWRWLALLAGAAAVAGVVTLLGWGDAALWYREQFGSALQEAPTRVATPAAPWGDHALMVEVSPADPARRLVNPLLRDEPARLAGKELTLGGWLWADSEAQVAAPGFLPGDYGNATLQIATVPITVTTTPTFFAHTFLLPERTSVLYYGFFASLVEAEPRPLRLFLDGAFLIEGTLPAGVEPRLVGDTVQVGEQRFPNLVRNPSAEQGWPQLRPAIERAMVGYSRRFPTYVVAALLDVERTLPYLATEVAPWLARDLFSAFGWGHVRLQGAAWNGLCYGAVALALGGAARWLVERRGRVERTRGAALALLAGLAGVVWLNALVWPLPYTWIPAPLPSARYVYPAIVPTALALVGGWWALAPRRLRPHAAALIVAALVLFNVAAIVTIRAFYLTIPPGFR